MKRNQAWLPALLVASVSVFWILAVSANANEPEQMKDKDAHGYDYQSRDYREKPQTNLPSAKIGEIAPDFELQNQQGETVRLGDFKDKNVVLIWSDPDCPFVARHEKEGTIGWLGDRLQDRDVALLVVEPGQDASTLSDRPGVDDSMMRDGTYEDDSIHRSGPGAYDSKTEAESRRNRPGYDMSTERPRAQPINYPGDPDKEKMGHEEKDEMRHEGKDTTRRTDQQDTSDAGAQDPNRGDAFFKARSGDTKIDQRVVRLSDPDGWVTKTYGVKTTPQVFIIDKQGKLVYNGAIDNDPQGRSERGERTNYILTSLDSLDNGGTVQPQTTKPYGCPVKIATREMEPGERDLNREQLGEEGRADLDRRSDMDQPTEQGDRVNAPSTSI